MRRRPLRADAPDAGAISTFVAISAAALVVLVGIVLEAGGQLRAIEQADARAQEAARAATQQLDEQAVLQGAGFHVISQQAAEAAANAYLAPYHLSADFVRVDGDTITVQFTTSYRTTLLSVVDIPELAVRGTGKAHLVHGITEAEKG